MPRRRSFVPRQLVRINKISGCLGGDCHMIIWRHFSTGAGASAGADASIDGSKLYSSMRGMSSCIWSPVVCLQNFCLGAIGEIFVLS